MRDLHDAFRELARDPDPLLFTRDRRTIPFARMHLDTRFRVRMGLLDGWEREAGEVRKGLQVLGATADGFVALSDEEAHNAALRVDFAASVCAAIYRPL